MAMKKIFLAFWIGLGLMLTACTPGFPASPTGTPSTTFEWTATPEDTPESKDTTTETYTALPPTATPTPEPPTSTPEPSATITNTPGTLDNYPPEGYGPVGFPDHINPLTGLEVSDPDLLERRPVAVKITNGPRSVRPQYGLSLADHVFEYYQEAGSTRFNAIFYGQDAEYVGPIRSARFADEHIVHIYKSVFAYGSADARVLWRLFDTGYGKRFVSISDNPCPPTLESPTCRTDPEVYNSLMSNTALLSQHISERRIDNSRQNLDGLVFMAPAPEGGTGGNSLTIRYSSGFYNRWVYDPLQGHYTRFQDAVDDYTNGNSEIYEPLLDMLTGEQISAENVVVIFARQTYFTQQPEMWEIQLLGSGNAYVFRDGNLYEMIWVRESEESLIQIKYADGSRFRLKPGKTWFQILGTSSSVFYDGPNWRIVHMMP
jgi:hypothetical protein